MMSEEKISSKDEPVEVPLASPVKEPERVAAANAPKKISPLKLFVIEHCSSCDAMEICKNEIESQRLCLEVQKLKAMACFAKAEMALAEALLKLERSQAPTVPLPATAPPKPASSPSVPVKRSTRPTEGIMQDGITWIWALNQAGARYQRALDKDNESSVAYFDLRERINKKMEAGHKGLVEDGKWYWISERGDFIGRKPAKDFSRRA